MFAKGTRYNLRRFTGDQSPLPDNPITFPAR